MGLYQQKSTIVLCIFHNIGMGSIVFPFSYCCAPYHSYFILFQIIHPKSDSQRKSLLEAVKEILLFRSLEPEQLTEVLDAMFERKVTPDEYIIKQGDDGDNFYVVDRFEFN